MKFVFYSIFFITLFLVTKTENKDKDEFGTGIDPNVRIVGGNYAKINQFPFLVSLKLNGEHFCGGSIIGIRWVLTTAHCFDRTITYLNKAIVQMGSTQLTWGGVIRTIDGIIPHGRYDLATYTNDICLVRVHPNIIYDSNVQPISLSATPPPIGNLAQIIGWGDTKFKGDLSNRLKFAMLMILPNWKCKEMLPRYMSDTLACGLAQVGEGTCNGDSGGPIIMDGKLIGLSCWGLYCAVGYPDTFTRVHLYIDWIKSNTDYYDRMPSNF